jgi:membrane protease YdiL (CAAX protease family)
MRAHSIRFACGLVLVVAAVLFVAPEHLVPWGGWVRAHFRRGAWPAMTMLVSLVFLIAGWILPSTPERTPRQPDVTMVALGLLLIAEPLIHLLVLAWGSGHPSPAICEVILPPALFPRGGGEVWPSVLRLATLALLVPVAEEFVFRGRLLPWLRQHLGTASAVSITTLAFAAAHGDVVQIVIAIPLGLLLAYVRLRSGDLGGCILAHAAHNCLFLVVGPTLIGRPWTAPALVMGGALLIALAWIHLRHPPSPHRHLRAAAMCLAVLSVIVLIFPAYRALQDWLWVRSAHQLVVYWRIDNAELMLRLDAARRRGHLNAARRAALAERLRQLPCQTQPRQTYVLAVLDPPATDDEAYLLLSDLASYVAPCPPMDDVARRIALDFPNAFADLVVDAPLVVARWLPLPAHANAARAQIIATIDPRRRRMLLAALERAWPGRVAGVILLLPADRVTPVDRRHLRACYPDVQERLRDLARTDPERAKAFGYEGE